MIAVAGLFGLTLLALIVFNAAVYALPLFAGLSIGIAALHSGAGPLGAVGLGLMAGVFVAALGRRLAASGALGPPVALLLVGAASLAGYQAGTAVAVLSGAVPAWAPVFGALGALVVSGTAWRRLRPAAWQG